MFLFNPPISTVRFLSWWVVIWLLQNIICGTWSQPIIQKSLLWCERCRHCICYQCQLLLILNPWKTFLDNWLTPRAAYNVLEEPDHHSSRKEPYSRNRRIKQEHNTIFLSLTPIMYHQVNVDCSVHNTGINTSVIVTEYNQQEQMIS